MLAGVARRAGAALAAAAAGPARRAAAAAAEPAAYAPTRFTSALATSSGGDASDDASAPSPVMPSLAFTRGLAGEAAATPTAAAPTPSASTPPPPLVVFGIDPDVSGALAVVACEGEPPSAAVRAALEAWEGAAGGPGAAAAAAAAADATASAARAAFTLVAVHDTPVEKVAVGKGLRSRPDPAAVVELVAGAAAAARSSSSASPSPPDIVAVIERPAPGFNNGRLSWLATGYAYGVWRAALAAAGVPALSVPASAWKRDLGLLRQGKDASRELAGAWLKEGGASGGEAGEGVEAAAAAAPPSSPSSTLTAKGGLLGRKRDHGRAEAALIALWGAAVGCRGGSGEVAAAAAAPPSSSPKPAAGRRRRPETAADLRPVLPGGGASRRAAAVAAGAAGKPSPPPPPGGSRRTASSAAAKGRRGRGPDPPAALPPSHAGQPQPPSFLAFTFITDDLVLPDGRTAMGVAGGSGPQAAWGWRLGCALEGRGVDDAPAAVVAGVGPDMPAPAREWLAETLGPGSGAAGLVGWGAAARTPRAWQVLEADGRRTQVWRTPASAARTSMLLPHPRRRGLAGLAAGAAASHAGVNPARARDVAWARALRSALPAGAWVSLETYEEPAAPPPRARLAAILDCATVFSPNLGELAGLVGGGVEAGRAGAVAGARRLIAAATPGRGLQGVVIRCGPDGAVWVPAGTGPALAVPAVPVAVSDTTGCGNAFLGGWTAVRVGGGSVARALAVGAAAAAAVAEVVGPPPAGLPGDVVEVARERAAAGEGRVVVEGL